MRVEPFVVCCTSFYTIINTMSFGEFLSSCLASSSKFDWFARGAQGALTYRVYAAYADDLIQKYQIENKKKTTTIHTRTERDVFIIYKEIVGARDGIRKCWATDMLMRRSPEWNCCPPSLATWRSPRGKNCQSKRLPLLCTVLSTWSCYSRRAAACSLSLSPALIPSNLSSCQSRNHM